MNRRPRRRAPDSSRHDRVVRHAVAAALTLTLLNVLKPLTVDDPSYFLHARHIAEEPLDPYGGEMFFQGVSGPSVRNVAPPVVVYWLALGFAAVGDHPGLLKVWLLPFALVLAAATVALVRRFARGLEVPGVWMVLLSPAILPSFNLMLDIPVLGVSLAAIALFLRATDRGSWPLALAAGAVAGLATQTKYNGATAVAVVLAAGLLRRRSWMAVTACALAAAVFVGWELWVGQRYGVSQLMHFVGRRVSGETGPAHVLDLVKPLFYTTGALAAPLIAVGLIGLGAGPRWVGAALAVVIGAYAGFALLPFPSGLPFHILEGRLQNPYNLTLIWLAPALLAVVLALLWRLHRRARPPAADASLPRRRWRSSFGSRFLTVWLGIEVLSYFAIATFPATRRMLGVLVVLLLIAFRLASRAVRRAPWRRRWIHASAALSVALGAVYFAVDLDHAWAERRTVDAVEQRVAAGGGGPIWYLATHWGGLQHYAPRAGMRPVYPGRSWLAPGDWLVVPWNLRAANQLASVDPRLVRVAIVPWASSLRVSTRQSFYRGSRPFRRPGADWESATLYRVVRGGRVVRIAPRPAVPQGAPL